MRTLFLLPLLPLLACGGAEVGEACETPGETDPCVEGAVCTNLSGSDAETTGDENQCLPRCDDDDDCAEDEGCRGISGTSLKSCQPDDV